MKIWQGAERNRIRSTAHKLGVMTVETITQPNGHDSAEEDTPHRATPLASTAPVVTTTADGDDTATQAVPLQPQTHQAASAPHDQHHQAERAATPSVGAEKWLRDENKYWLGAPYGGRRRKRIARPPRFRAWHPSLSIVLLGVVAAIALAACLGAYQFGTLSYGFLHGTPTPTATPHIQHNVTPKSKQP